MLLSRARFSSIGPAGSLPCIYVSRLFGKQRRWIGTVSPPIRFSNEAVHGLLTSLSPSLDASDDTPDIALSSYQDHKNACAIAIEVMGSLKQNHLTSTPVFLAKTMMRLRGSSTKVPEVREAVAQLSGCIAACRDLFTPSDICAAFSSVKSFESSFPVVRDLLDSLTAQLNRIPSDAYFSASDLSVALSGLRRCSVVVDSVHFAFQALAFRLDACTGVFSFTELGDAIIGFKSSNVESPQARDAFQAVLKKFPTRGELLSKSLGKCLSGLRCSTSRSPDVLRYLSALTPFINEADDLITPKSITSALGGMRSLRSSHKEVRGVIAALTPKVDACASEVSGHQLRLLFQGLRKFDSCDPEVRLLIAVLARLIAAGDKPFDRFTIYRVLGSMSLFSSEYSEVRALLQAMTPKISACDTGISLNYLVGAIGGLHRCSADFPEVRELYAALKPLAESAMASMKDSSGPAAMVPSEMRAKLKRSLLKDACKCPEAAGLLAAFGIQVPLVRDTVIVTV